MTIALTSLPRASTEAFIHTLLQDPHGVYDDLVERYHTHTLSRLLCQNAAVNVVRGNGCLIHNYEPLPSPKINQLVIPTGSTRWSYCVLLADDAIKDQIYVACDNGSTKLNLIFGSPITGREEHEHAITLTVNVLPPRQLSPNSDDETINKLWLIPVVDERYYWQFAHTEDLSVTVADSNITAPNDAAELLLDQLTVDYLNVGVNTAHTIVPSCLTRNDYENLPIVLDSILAHYGQRLVADIGSYNDVTGKYGNIEFTVPPPGSTRWVLIDGLNSVAVFDNAMQGKLGLRECTWVNATTATPNASAADYNVGRPFVVAGGVSSSYGTVENYTPYASTPSSVDIQTTVGTYVNKTPGSQYKTAPVTAIWRTEFDEEPPTAMVTQIGRDYFYQFYRQFDFTFAGVQPWQQTYFDDYMVIRQTWNPKTQGYDAYTRVCSRQPNMSGEWVGTPADRFEAVLKADLESPASSVDPPTSAEVYLLKQNAAGDLEATGDPIAVYNYDPELTGDRGTYCRFEVIQGRRKFYYVGCSFQQDLVDQMIVLEA